MTSSDLRDMNVIIFDQFKFSAVGYLSYIGAPQVIWTIAMQRFYSKLSSKPLC